jgi:hypothetical protein
MLSQLSILPNKMRLQRGLVFGALIVTALFAFEVFNYSTTNFALSDVLGNLEFVGVTWATILSIAFCGIDFAGIARLFTPEQGQDEPAEVWYLFGAWMLAALMNAILTWWGVSIAILNHQSLGNAVIARETLLKVVPVFVAIMVWLIRVLIIGTISVAGDRIFSQDRLATAKRSSRSRRSSSRRRTSTSRRAVRASSFTPAPKTSNSRDQHQSQRREPTYHPISFGSSQNSYNKDRSQRTQF